MTHNFDTLSSGTTTSPKWFNFILAAFFPPPGSSYPPNPPKGEKLVEGAPISPHMRRDIGLLPIEQQVDFTRYR